MTSSKLALVLLFVFGVASLSGAQTGRAVFPPMSLPTRATGFRC